MFSKYGPMNRNNIAECLDTNKVVGSTCKIVLMRGKDGYRIELKIILSKLRGVQGVIDGAELIPSG